MARGLGFSPDTPAQGPCPAPLPPHLLVFLTSHPGSWTQDSPPPSHPLKAVPIAVADEGESESEDDDLKPRGNSPASCAAWTGGAA